MILRAMSKATTPCHSSKTYFVGGIMILYFCEILFKGPLIYIRAAYINYPQRRSVLRLGDQKSSE